MSVYPNIGTKVLDNRLHTSILVFSLALAARLLYVVFFDAEISVGDDPWYFLKIANNILEGNGFLEGNLLAYRPPLYPAFMAGVMAVTGGSIEAIRVIQALLGAIMCVGIYRIGAIMAGKLTGLVAGLFCAVYPQLIHYSVQVYSEQLFLFLVVMALWLFLRSEESGSVRQKVLAGVLFGLSALTREVGLFVLGGLLVWLIISNRSLIAGLRRGWLVWLCAFIVILPWTIRNYQVFGKLVPITTNGGINFYMGNNPEATGAYHWVLAPEVVWNKPSEMGLYETQANALGYKYGLEFIKENLGRSFQLVFLRAYRLLQPPVHILNFEESIVETASKIVWLIMYVVILLPSIVVAPFYLRRNTTVLSLVLITLGALIIPFLATYGATRYCVSLIPFMALAGAVPISQLLGRFLPDRILPNEKSEWAGDSKNY